jgi:hypothetical protein
MAQLRCAISGDHHFFIIAGRSKGVWQIEAAGIAWLKKKGYSLPRPGGWVPLDRGDYRYLDRQGYLYIKGEEHYIKGEEHLKFPALRLVAPETAHHGPPLLLQLADNYQDASYSVPWRLILRLDEWEENVRDVLLREHATDVGYYTSSENGEWFFSNMSLQKAHDAGYWPDVAPRKDDYMLCWQRGEVIKHLKEATPTAGLKAGWQGNIFFRFSGSDLPNTWKRYLPGMSISASNFQDFYWLAESNEKPEPDWPGEAQRVGPPNRGWQLWHLQKTPDTDIEDLIEWFWYRQIHLNYPTWRLHLLNPFSRLAGRGYNCVPGQQLLVRCDPPIRPAGKQTTNVHLSLTQYPKGAQRPLAGSPVRSQPLVPHSENYLRVPAPPADREYRLFLDGEASGSSLWVRTTPLSTRQPIWLHGLRCSLAIAGKERTVSAFSKEPTNAPYVLSVHKDFSPDQLAEMIWSYRPSGIPCSLHWKYLASDEKPCQGSTTVQTDHALTNWWQTYIWPAVAESSWVRLTLDAASFGRITLCLILKKQELENCSNLPADSERSLDAGAVSSKTSEFEKVSTGVKQKAWWADTRYTAAFFWLSRMAHQEADSAHQTISPELSHALEQLYVPGIPTPLKNALELLTTNQYLPIWIAARLRALLAEGHATFESISQEEQE